MICPICGIENNDNWPVEIDGKIKDGGCRDCFDKQCDDKWWDTVIAIDIITGRISKPKER